MGGNTAPIVKRRLVFYLPGFDPSPPNRYREGYASEGAKQAEISNYDLTVKRLSSEDNVSRFQSDMRISSHEIRAEIRVLAWNDLVRDAMGVPIWQSLLVMMKTGRVIANSGALWRLIRLRRPPNIAGLFPFMAIPIVALLGYLLGAFIGGFLGGGIVSIVLGVVGLVGASLWFRRIDNVHLAYYMLHDLGLITEVGGYTPPQLRPRLEAFKDQIADGFDQDFDEILLVGHSSGAHLAVLIAAELVREGRITDHKRFALLTLGHAIPLVSYLPTASDLRLALAELGVNKDICWVDVTAPTDGAAFSLCDPVACSVTLDQPQANPLVLSAAFTNTLSADYRKRLKWRFFRQHFQYLCHFDQPDHYDYFQITSGPMRLCDRYNGFVSSPSTRRVNLNGFSEQHP